MKRTTIVSHETSRSRLRFYCANYRHCGRMHSRMRSDGRPEAYCRECANAYQRANRKRHMELSDEQRRRANARSYTNVYVRRGLIVKKPCEGIRNGKRCMRRKVQAHHDDYSKPLAVRWLCDECHRAHHREHG